MSHTPAGETVGSGDRDRALARSHAHRESYDRSSSRWQGGSRSRASRVTRDNPLERRSRFQSRRPSICCATPKDSVRKQWLAIWTERTEEKSVCVPLRRLELPWFPIGNSAKTVPNLPWRRTPRLGVRHKQIASPRTGVPPPWMYKPRETALSSMTYRDSDTWHPSRRPPSPVWESPSCWPRWGWRSVSPQARL